MRRVLLAGALVAAFVPLAASTVGGGARLAGFAVQDPAPKATVTMTLVVDGTLAGSGLHVVASRAFDKDSGAHEAMKALVPQADSFGMVTSICGVEAGKHKAYWALYVNGKYTDVGIAGLKLAADTTVHWRLESLASYGKK